MHVALSSLALEQGAGGTDDMNNGHHVDLITTIAKRCDTVEEVIDALDSAGYTVGLVRSTISAGSDAGSPTLKDGTPLEIRVSTPNGATRVC